MQGTQFAKCVGASQLVFRNLTVNSFTPRYFILGGPFRQIASSPVRVNCSVFNKTIKSFKASNSFLTVNHTSKLSRRKFSEIPRDFCGSKTLEGLHHRDGIPKSYTLIYRTNFPNYLMFSQMFVFLAVGATITASLFVLITGGLTEEQKAEKKAKQSEEVQKRNLIELESDAMKALQEFKDQQGVKDPTSKPQIEDLLEGDVNEIAVMAMVFITLAIGLFRIQRFLPVRIYANQKNHCVAIMYGHLLPGRVTLHEFVAGTVRPAKQKIKMDFFSHSLYQDGSGKNLILMEQFFRTPADFNRLLGFQKEDIMTEKEIAKRQRRL